MFTEIEEALRRAIGEVSGLTVKLAECEKPCIALKRGKIELWSDKSVSEEERESIWEGDVEVDGRSIMLEHTPIAGSLEILEGETPNYRVVGRELKFYKPYRGRIKVRYRYVGSVVKSKSLQYKATYFVKIYANSYDDLDGEMEAILRALILRNNNIDVKAVKISSKEPMAVIKLIVNGSWTLKEVEGKVIKEIRIGIESKESTTL